MVSLYIMVCDTEIGEKFNTAKEWLFSAVANSESVTV